MDTRTEHSIPVAVIPVQNTEDNMISVITLLYIQEDINPFW